MSPGRATQPELGAWLISKLAHPGEVVSEIGRASLNPGEDHANCADEKGELAFLGGKDVLDLD